MKDLTVIVRRVLRRRLRSKEGVDRLVGEFLNAEEKAWSSSSRLERENIVEHITSQIEQWLSTRSFASTAASPDTVRDFERGTIVH